MKKIEWSDFEWFKKKSRVVVENMYFTCSEKKGINQKIIFPIKNMSKYLTFSLSKKYMDLHLSHEDKQIPQKPIFQFRNNQVKRSIKNKMMKSKVSTFIPFSKNCLGGLILVNPYSNEFVSNIHKMYNLNIKPNVLRKLRMKSMKGYHNQILLAYDYGGRCKGVIKCNHRKNGFDFVSTETIEEIQGKHVDIQQVKKTLRDIGLREDTKIQEFWKHWDRFLNCLDVFDNLKRKITRNCMRY